MNLYREAGELLLGSRLKRMGERFLTEISRVYRSSDIDFDPAWFPVFFLLDREKTVIISRFAEKLQISQSGATQLINGLEKKELLEEVQAEGRDRRTKSIRFTPLGLDRLAEVRPVWRALTHVMDSLLCGGPGSSRFLPALTGLEDSFDEISLGDRVLTELQRQRLLKSLSLVPWNRKYDRSYRRALLHRLSASPLTLSPEEEGVLKNPEAAGSGRELLILIADGEVIGFTIYLRSSEPQMSAFFIRPDWEGCGVEDLLVTLIDGIAGKNTPAALMIDQNQRALIAAAGKHSYNLLCWEDNLITLKRNQ